MKKVNLPRHTVTRYSLADVLESLAPTSEGQVIILPVRVRDDVVIELRQYEALVQEMEGKREEDE